MQGAPSMPWTLTESYFQKEICNLRLETGVGVSLAKSLEQGMCLRQERNVPRDRG